MSLLIKALEQAAKDREAAKVEPRIAAAANTAATDNVAPIGPDGAQRRSVSSLSSLSDVQAQQRARAAAVVQAGAGRAGKMIDYLRANPIALIAAIAVLFGVGFGGYVYLQVSHPSLMAKTPPPPPPAPPQPSTPAAAQTPQPSAASTSASAPTTLPASASPTPVSPSPTPQSTAVPASTSDAAKLTTATAGIAAGSATSSASAAPSTEPQRPVSTAAVLPRSGAIAENTGTTSDRAVTRLRDASPTRDAPRETAAAPRAARTPTPAAPRQDSAPRERIVVSAGSAKPVLNPTLSRAYSELQSGNVEQARALYGRVSDAEPLNIDALLGLAYIAAQENRTDDATKSYMRILQLDPRNTLAQAGMIGIMGRADPLAAESRLKQLLAREPSPFLHFVLGNLYADQGRWPQAQQAYFQAHHLEPDNPDYAYNLAVSLDQLRQSKLALGYYRRAEQLATSQGRSNFNVAQARERIRSLSSQVE